MGICKYYYNLVWMQKKKFVFVLTGRNGVSFVILILSWGLGLGGRKLVELRSKEYIRIYIVRCANLDYNNKISCWLSYSPSLWIAFYIAKISDNDDIYFCSKLFLASKFFTYQCLNSITIIQLFTVLVILIKFWK